MRILISNDDGIAAAGLATLEEIAHQLTDDVWTVAPEVDQSGMSRSVTLTRPLRARKLGERRFAVDGTPTDCVHLGVTQIVDGARPDLILSGVNHGQNVAEDVTFSGTIAVAFQGMSLGIPSIALSQARSETHGPRFATARAWGPSVLRALLRAGWPRDVILSVNFPDCDADAVTGVDVAAQGSRAQIELYAEERTDLRQRRYYWFGFNNCGAEPAVGTDLRALRDGRIAVTPLHLALTHEGAMPALKDALGGLVRD